MGKEYHGKLEGKGLKFALIVSRFNEFFSKKLLEGAADCLKRHGVSDNMIDVYWVPGSFEIPAIVRRVSQKKYSAIVCLGAVIKGDTPHFTYVAAEVSKGVAQVALDAKMPITFGVLTCDTLDQAIERSGAKAGNKGYQAAEAALEMADLVSQIGK